MDIKDSNVLVLGGSGLVGMAVCRQLLDRNPSRIQIHSLKQSEAEEACTELAPEAGNTEIVASAGDIFGLVDERPRRDEIIAHLRQLADGDLPSFRLYRLLTDNQPDLVIDCVNTATAIAYRNVYRAAEATWAGLDALGEHTDDVERLLESLYIPRLIRHVQVLYRGMIEAKTRVYIKIGTSGTGGMGLNVPYTHSEEKPSRTLLSKSAVAGAHSMLLFLVARTPGAPITKEIKPAAAIAWKRIGYGPIARRGKPIRIAKSRPTAIGATFSSDDPETAEMTAEALETVFIDSGENGIFSLEEFALLSSAEQMEFVTPEEIAQSLIFEIEGGNTGHDIINALNNAVMGPTYRAGMMRHWALSQMADLERQGSTRSVAFEMLGPPRNSKLLFEAHLLREAFDTMIALRESSAEEVSARLDRLVRENRRLADEVVSVGIPILLPSGELLRGREVLLPEKAVDEPVTPEKLENWVAAGWVDLRPDNCGRWVERCRRIHREIESIPADDTSSRTLRNRRFWDEERSIQPGKFVGWILSVEEAGGRIKH